MKVLVIPDVHLKPWMFDSAAKLMRKGEADKAVCLMDLPDDWHAAYDKNLYIETFDAALRFQKEFPETLWCYGNHDMSYVWGLDESGYSVHCAGIVREKMTELSEAVPEEQMAFIHKIDNVMFVHGGLTEYFVRKHIPEEDHDNVDMVIERINNFGAAEMWENPSPIWHRPEMGPGYEMYKENCLMQVVGHTPVTSIRKDRNTITCDVFSTYPSGVPIGTQEFTVIDTETQEFCGAKAPF